MRQCENIFVFINLTKSIGSDLGGALTKSIGSDLGGALTKSIGSDLGGAVPPPPPPPPQTPPMPSNKNKDNVEVRFYSVVTCLTPILHNVFQSSSMH